LKENTMTTTPRLVKPFTQVNTTDAAVGFGGTPFQGEGQLTGLPDGGYVVVWTDFSRTLIFGSEIVGQRYDSLGNKVGGEVVITRFPTGDHSWPAVTTLSNGDIAVAYLHNNNNVFDNNVYVDIYSSALVFVRTDIIDESGSQTADPSITALAGGGYAISYTQVTGTPVSGLNFDVVARVVSPTGTVGARLDVQSSPDQYYQSEVTTLSNGNFVVVYTDDFFTEDQDIHFRILTAAGTPVTGDLFVPGGNDSVYEFDPAVAALKDGGFVVVWTDRGDPTGDIRATILNNAGASIASNILVNTTTAGLQDEASVVVLADGGFLVSWEDDTANLIRAQRFDAVGNKIGTEFTVKNGVVDGDQELDRPDAALLSDGRIAFALSDRDNVSIGDVDVLTSIWRARDVSHDFDGDGKSGVLWRHDSGQVYFWEMDGLGIKAEGSVAHAPVPTDWHIQGAGDFDGDGNNDVLWRHDSGQVYFWEMDGQAIKAEGAAAHAPVPNEWHIQGVGDFDADGKSDVLWRHDSGPVYIWEMDGLGTKAEGGVAHAAVPTDWHIQGVGDFDGDGKSDILWRHDSGQVYIWEMNGPGIKAEGGIAHAPVPTDWHIEGLGDFDGDGKSDILWRHDSGQVYIWEMDGLNVKTEGTIAHAAVPNDWHVQDIGDYNNDGKSDILWRHDSGQVYTWEMNGLGVTAEGSVPHAAVPSDWHIFSQENFV